MRLEGLGHANGEITGAGGSLAKLGSIVAGESSAVSAAPSQAPGAPPSLTAPARRQVAREDLKKRISTAAIAFRGYDATNIGRSPELLEHPAYGPIVRATLESASALCSDALGEKVDLVARMLAHEPSDLSTFVQDIGTVVGMQVAQVRILEEVFDIPVRQARLSFGHSIGELSALVLGGVYEMEQLLPIPLSLATDCAELTADTTMGILSVHGAMLQIEDVEHLCASISRQGHGLIGPSTYLSPYQVLLIGQHDTLEPARAGDARLSSRRRHAAAPAEPLAAVAHAAGLGAEYSQPNRDGDASHRRRRSQADAGRRVVCHAAAPATTSGTAARSWPTGPTIPSGCGTSWRTPWPRGPKSCFTSGPSRNCSRPASSG